MHARSGEEDVRLSEPVPGEPVLSSTAFDLASVGYAVEERFIAGRAAAFSLGGATGDGQWTLAPAGEAPFTTRMVIHHPVDPSGFNGVVLVEWINVSPSTDVAPMWLWAHREMIRAGYMWIGVSVQRAGLEGGGFYRGPAPALKSAAPERYEALRHPGDGYAFDMFSQAAAAIRARLGRTLLPGYHAQRYLAVGASQSAMCLVAYINGLADQHRRFDGYLLSGRTAGAFLFDGTPPSGPGGVRIREDLSFPVMVVQSETDVVGARGSFDARQDDTDSFRLWEIAGAAHMDTYNMAAGFIDSGLIPLETLAAACAPVDQLIGMELGRPINSGPQQHYVLQAALRHLDRWSAGGPAPPRASRLDVESVNPPAFMTDEHGIATGGVRTPWVDAPRAVLSGLWPADCSPPLGMFGRTEPFSAEKLAQLYPAGVAAYLDQFAVAANEAVNAGFILAADQDEIVALARSELEFD